MKFDRSVERAEFILILAFKIVVYFALLLVEFRTSFQSRSDAKQPCRKVYLAV